MRNYGNIKMIITKILGGLGNQMFQYAIGRAISLEYATSLRLDISGFEKYKLHQRIEFKRIFNCAEVIAQEADLRDVLSWQCSTRIRQFLLRPSMAVFRRKEFVVEPSFQYWPGIKDIPANSYLSGYWQSEKYFLDFATQIREDFTFKQPLNSLNAELAKTIAQINAVSLHVRRGDYANNPLTTATHGLCSLEYYRSAIKYISKKIQHPHFMVFSDDIEWVKNNLQIDFPHQYVDHNHGAESYNDMRIMSMCKHHIIANSSFSWWGAWLDPRADKIVVAPAGWFAHETNTQDLIPQSWVRM
jgi:hypothetical protein